MTHKGVHQAEAHEAQILRLVARNELSAEQQCRLRDLTAQTSDWGKVCRLAQYNGITPLLNRQIAAHCADLTPPQVVDELSRQCRTLARRNYMQTAELVRISQVCALEGIQIIVFKGPALAATAYGDTALRPFGDIDVLVKEADCERLWQILTESGYTTKPQTSVDLFRPLLVKLGHEQSFERHNERNTVTSLIDLHWSLYVDYLGRSTSLTLLPPNPIVLCGDSSLRTLAPEELLVFLAVHGTKHRWEMMLWAVDVGELIARTPNLDWEKVDSICAELRTERMLALALNLAVEHLQLPCVVPTRWLEMFARDKTLQSLATRSTKKWYIDSPPPPEQLRASWYYKTRAFDRHIDGWRFLLHELFAPTVREWMAYPFPAAMLPLYYVLRPVLLVRGFLGRLIKETVAR